MKVKSEFIQDGRCDFCGFYVPEFTINGGLWWICRPCMSQHYDGCTCTEDLVLVHSGECKYSRVPGKCTGLNVKCTPDVCFCGEEE